VSIVVTRDTGPVLTNKLTYHCCVVRENVHKSDVSPLG